MLYTAEQYKNMRESYCYNDSKCKFKILPTDNLEDRFTGKYEGIFSGRVQQYYLNGINLRKFELIIQAVFADIKNASLNNAITSNHCANLKEIICAIVHWKMASQGGRPDLKVANVKKKWKDDTIALLIRAYDNKDLALFEIGGVRIPTATTFLRFLFPDEYGIMDCRVAKVTQSQNITQLDIRDDGWIKDKNQNKKQYKQNYIPFLVNEACQLNQLKIFFQDIDEQGKEKAFKFRACDIEMALFGKEY